MENLPESVSLHCVFLGQDEAVGAEFDRTVPRLAQCAVAPQLLLLSCALSITMKHMLRFCDHNDTGMPEPCCDPRIMSTKDERTDSTGDSLMCQVHKISHITFPLTHLL